MDPGTVPKPSHKPVMVPIHWKEAVHTGLKWNIRLGVLGEVRLNTPVTCQSQMLITAKRDGTPCRVVYYQKLNSMSHRQTHHTLLPWHLVSRITGRESTRIAI